MSNKKSNNELIKRSFRQSFINLWRNKVLSIATIFVIGTIIFIFNIILAINYIADSTMTNLSEKIDIVVYLKESTTVEESQSLSNKIANLEGINKITYLSKEDALNQLKTTNPNISSMFEKYGISNPLPTSLNISTKHPKYHQNIINFLQNSSENRLISNISGQDANQQSKIINSISENLNELSKFTNQIIFWLILIFVIGGALIIINALQITIFNRKKEISIMNIVGAPHWFIKLPFIIESIFYGLLATTLSFILLYIFSKNIHIKEVSIWNYYSGFEFYKIFLLELLTTILLSIISSNFAIREYLKSKR